MVDRHFKCRVTLGGQFSGSCIKLVFRSSRTFKFMGIYKLPLRSIQSHDYVYRIRQRSWKQDFKQHEVEIAMFPLVQQLLERN